MNIAKLSLNVLYVCLFSMGILSCSSSKKVEDEINAEDKEAIVELKSELKFKTHYGFEGVTDITATNSSNNTLDISHLLLHIEQEGSNKYKTHTLDDLHLVDKLDSGAAIEIQLSLDEIIESDFGGKTDSYNVSIVYKSGSALKNGDERNIYFISYKYKGK